MFCYKIHTCGNEVLVAVCDKDILGKTFFEGELQLEVKASFYHRGVASLAELEKVLSGATIANLAGNRVVDSAICAGYVEKENVLVIGGIKHAQFAVLL
ncbi:MAG: DUF424 family protein [Candidatus Altiarchaeia archaeon]